MNHLSRRSLLQSSLAVAAAFAASGSSRAADEPSTSKPDPWLGLRIGVASYSLRKLPLDACIKGIQRVGLRYVSIKDFHLPLKFTADERKAVIAKFKAADITPLSCGVISMNDEASVKQAFEYARDCSMPTIVCNPNPALLSLIENEVKESDIKIAIHNHGPEDKRFPSPFDAMKLIEKLDPRVGLCIDVGHTARAKVDPADAIRKCAARVHDIHLKDIVSTFPTGRNIEVGRGVLDIRAVMAALLEIKFPGHVGFEYEINADDPIPGLAECVGYTRGILKSLAHA